MYKSLILFLMLFSFVQIGFQKWQQHQEDQIIGTYKWNNEQYVSIRSNGEILATNGIRGKWMSLDITNNKYLIAWNKDDIVNILFLDPLTKKLHGKNIQGLDVWGDRLISK